MRFAYEVGVMLTFIALSEGVIFYPYGNSTSDKILEPNDDRFFTISLNFGFPFFFETFWELHISTNGITYFGQGSNDYIPRAFPLLGTKCVAAYWVDSDPREGGNIFYREVFDPNVLSDVSNDIRLKFINHATFRSMWAFIVTFKDVPRYGCRENSNYPCHNVVSHQTILTSDGFVSFVIFLYDRLEYNDAQIGYSAGNHRTSDQLIQSRTSSIAKQALQESNVGVPGKWMFQLFIEINNICKDNISLDVSPKKVNHIGCQEIMITGPCLLEERIHFNVSVKFERTTVQCVVKLYWPNKMLVCNKPHIMDVVGKNNIYLNINNKSFTGFIISRVLSNKMTRYSNLQYTDDVDAPLNITWNVKPFNEINICGVQEDIVVDEFGNIVALEKTQIDIKPPNNGFYAYLSNNYTERTGQQLNLANVIRTINYFVEDAIYEKILIGPRVHFSCDVWHKSQPSEVEINEVLEQFSRRYPCPPTVPFNFPYRLSNNFEADEMCHPNIDSFRCQTYRVGAKGCYRGGSDSENISVQCCYDYNRRLLIGPPGGGTIFLNVSKTSQVNFFTKEIVPHLFCCENDDKCVQFYSKRPSVSSNNFIDNSLVRKNMDSNFMTLDGNKYDFNPAGEFIYLQGDDFTIHAKISRSNFRSSKPVSYFSAFAIKVPDLDVVQIGLTSFNTLHVRHGTTTLNHGEREQNSILLVNFVNDSHICVETEDLKMQIQVFHGMLRSTVTLNELLKGRVFGLLGNWDDDGENDFMLPNKTFIPKNSSDADIYYKFGMEWATNTNTSIFSSPPSMDLGDLIFAATFDDEIAPVMEALTNTKNSEIDDDNCDLSLNVPKTYYDKLNSTFERYAIFCKPGINSSRNHTMSCKRNKAIIKLDCETFISTGGRNIINIFIQILFALFYSIYLLL